MNYEVTKEGRVVQTFTIKLTGSGRDNKGARRGIESGNGESSGQSGQTTLVTSEHMGERVRISGRHQS